ncbi:MAG: hypothetical protein VKJ24_11945 [Synechococcales bacterium]|nr:hypothetical protein [Synechococcales bacterium]
MNLSSSSTATYPHSTDLSADDYLVLGLATCFVKAEGEVHPIQVIEPIPAAALEAIVKGIPTSYELAIATTLGATIREDQLQKPTNFPTEAHFCDDFAFRASSAARTFKARAIAQTIIPLGSTSKNFNYSTERKRILNLDQIVKPEDNVKQHAYTHQVL